MFPSQAQIGQDMARERQQLAARIRMSQAAQERQARPKRSPALLGRILAIGKLFRRPLRSVEQEMG
jgi:hypothetical protein